MSRPALAGPAMRAGPCRVIATGPLELLGAPWGHWLEGSLLTPGPWPTSSPRVIAFTGSLSGTDDEGSIRNWMPEGIDALRSAVDAAAADAAARGQQLLLVPHAMHLLSDVHSCLRLMRDHPRVRLLLSPASLLTGSMFAHHADHIARSIQTLAHHADAIVLHDLRCEADADGEPRAVACAWGSGELDAAATESLIPPGMPVLTLSA